MFGSIASIVLLVTLIALAGLLWQLWTGWRAAAWLRDPPPGLVLVEGTTAPWDGLRQATLSGGSCLWEGWEVETWRSSVSGPDRTGRWSTEEQGASRAPFLLVTPQGHRILICPDVVDTRMLPVRQWKGSAPRPGGEAGLLSEMTGGLLGRRYRYSERLVLEAQPLFALGRPEQPRPGDPPGIDGRLLPGPGGMLLGLEPPAQAAARARRRVLWQGALSGSVLLLMLAVLLAGPAFLPNLLGLFTGGAFGGLGHVGR
ncbi:hypothetical protein [Pseudoroseomonas cervicalis]|uniref:hypothetical protein n=1 Tax=Teichococcus cervicalis TaxID=204525 RepID=UPI0022F1A83F|nr:hypothetical protein [Pseudoroseomonas cervicalis]WBV43806.1 hypothetical protein PFY06_04355 [Pseudoroseomonas cervicalis]